ncbi:DUF305 domain-containing protein [Couchioplanes caeruleus]|uniref:DUF305 domain-containing protein n=2 Tax=Couchioplanes caeruleus TaxID=56438 RepID=A0A1K0FC04_9ACTN|nr:DUF305 domain-containing protein [Couchioplanes caeruleus]OJF10361.1 DUF305 domain-containing protein [Couchioplanes caeruleus subsp. caeruleus]ROP32299.1 uncharacterized protein (DUF305 family) [Couchioplanes caeruleus]
MTVSTDSDSDPDPDAAASAAARAGEPTRTGAHRFGVGWLALVLTFGLLVGAGAGFLGPRLLGTPKDDSAEAGFLRDMSTHHAQAVEMSMIAHANSADAQVVTLSGDIALTQHGQISTMLAWLREWNLSPTGSQPAMAWMPGAEGSVRNGLMPGMATPDQLATLRKATGKDLDIQYLTLMRQHHLGGIHMAQGVLELSDEEKVTGLAQTMVNGQQSEINLIDTMLKRIQQG